MYSYDKGLGFGANVHKYVGLHNICSPQHLEKLLTLSVQIHNARAH